MLYCMVEEKKRWQRHAVALKVSGENGSYHFNLHLVVLVNIEKIILLDRWAQYGRGSGHFLIRT